MLPYEIGNALSALVKRQRLTESEAITALGITNEIPVKLIKTNIQEALEIAIKFNIYAYDAYYIQCALSTNNPVLTLDKRMKAVANELSINTLELL